MRGHVSEKLKPFLQQVNVAISEAKEQQIPFDVETTRTNLDNLKQFLDQGPEITFVKDRELLVKDTSVATRIYNPCPEKALPVILHFHGGGHMCGSVDLYDSISRKVAQKCQCIVIFVDYRLAPEHPYPAGVNDCQLALENYHLVIDDMKYTDDIFIMGDSAGGAICSTLAMRSLSDPNLRIDKQILIYPSLDYTMSSRSIEENGHGFLLEKEKVHWYFQQYFQSTEQTDIFHNASPLFGAISDKLPATLVISAGCDPLRDEALHYVNLLEEAGATVEHYKFDEMIHAYMLLNNLVESECFETYQRISNFV